MPTCLVRRYCCLSHREHRTGTHGVCSRGGDGVKVPLASETPAAEVTATEIPAEVPATEVPITGIAVTGGIAVGKYEGGCKRLAEQEPGEQARTEAEAAPVGRGEAGVDIADRCAIDLHVAYLG